MRQLTHKRLTAWLLTLVMALSLLPAAALADEADDGLSPPAPQEDYGYVRLVFSEGEQLDLHHGEYITERSPTAAVHDGADEDFIANGEYAALYYEGRLYHKAALDGVRIDADAVLPAEDFALVPMGELAAQAPPLGAEQVALTVEGTNEGTTEGTTEETTGGTNEGTTEGTTGGTTEGTNGGTNKQQETLPSPPPSPPPTLVRKAPGWRRKSIPTAECRSSLRTWTPKMKTGFSWKTASTSRSARRTPQSKPLEAMSKPAEISSPTATI